VKIRKSLVSNSSSSSFIIGVKGELKKERLVELLSVPQESLLRPFAEDVADVLMRAEELTGTELAQELEWDDDDRLLSLLKQGYTVYEGSASDEGNGATEYALCFMEINYTSDDLVIIKEGGY
jgi:hypothetical protein